MMNRGVPEHGAKRAEAARVPGEGGALRRVREQEQEKLRADEAEERRRLLRVLVVLAVVVLVASMMRAGWGRVFVPGWWRLW